jgi:hypothetical protein
MIDAIFGGEFDILKGCVVKVLIPSIEHYNEAVVSSYMIPDGVHKFEYDLSVFRYKMLDIEMQK